MARSPNQLGADREAVVVPLRVDDAGLVEALARRQPWAGEELVRRYGRDVRRVLARIVGPTAELPDLVHEVIVRALDRLDTLRDTSQLRSWLVGMSVRVAREHLRQRRRFPRPVAPERLPDRGVRPDPEAHRQLGRVFDLMDALPPDERIVFALRFVDGMELKEVAQAVGVSLATVKRRLKRASDGFSRAAEADPLLAARLRGGDRWTDR